MASPPTTQDLLECMDDGSWLKVVLHFEGRNLPAELPVGGEDGATFLAALESLVADTARGSGGGAAPSPAEKNSASQEFDFFSVSSSNANGAASHHPQPLSAPAVLAAAKRDGMVLAARRGAATAADSSHDGSSKPALIAEKGISLTVDVTPSCSILLNGGVDYDLPTALAELIDNSIAALDSPTTSATNEGIRSKVRVTLLVCHV